MCILFISLLEGRTKPYRIVILNNRDEFWERPTAEAAFWDDTDRAVLAGRDLVRGGTWFGVTRSGRFATLTNFRVPIHLLQNDKKSRGELPSEFLKGSMSPKDYADQVATTMTDYDGFNLLVGDLVTGDIWCISNRDPDRVLPVQLEPGKLYGLSNAVLEVPWPKIVRGKQLINQIPVDHTQEDKLIDQYLGILADTERPKDEELPQTGVPLELERCYSSVCVQEIVRDDQYHYGTRTSIIVLVDVNNRLRYVEKNLNVETREWTSRSFEFSIAI